jgi:hypothetical protein
VTNALAYYGVEFISAVKSSMKETPERKLLLIRNFFFGKKQQKEELKLSPLHSGKKHGLLIY